MALWPSLDNTTMVAAAQVLKLPGGGVRDDL